ncbi:hypothetical protein BGZ83_010042 [Gryganskiella cystojenkinii]|nr:hypothetical protein BGZ83_010042 [Gryganskiella cystojenkinii]
MISETHNPIPDAKQLLVPVSDEQGYADYLAELTAFLPHSISQFGLTLTTALEIKENPNCQARTKDPNLRQEDTDTPVASTKRPPHYRTIGMPIAGTDSKQTVIDLTISGHAVSYFPRSQNQLVDALVEDAKQAGEVVERSQALIAVTEAKTAQYLTKESADPVHVGHDRNVRTVLSSVVAQLKELRAGEGKLSKGHRAVKFIITEKKLLESEALIVQECERIERDHGLVLESMQQKDVPQMIQSNAVPYSDSYGRFIVKTSRCFRNKDGKMVAWAGSHEDFSVAALYVVPAYRKMGLGRLVLMALALAHVRLARSILDSRGPDASPIDSELIVAHADCIDDNHPTIVFMERCGWTPTGYSNWVGLLNSDEE